MSPARLFCGLLVAAGLAAGTACRGTTELPNPMPIDAGAYDAVYEASIDVLGRAGYRVVQRDYRFGELATAPRSSPTILEFWHGDNNTLEQAALSTLSDVRRVVRIALEPAPGPAGPVDGAGADAGTGDDAGADAGAAGKGPVAAGYTLEVAVALERRQMPTRRMTGSVRTGVFSELREVPAEWAARGISRWYWEPVGRDAHLEQRLLRRITRRAERLRERG